MLFVSTKMGKRFEKRLILILACFFSLNLLMAQPPTTSQEKISYECKNQQLYKALDQIQRLSNYYRIQYVMEDVSPYRTTASLKNASIESAVRQLLQGTSLNYEINNRFIHIFRKEQQVVKGKTDSINVVRGHVYDKSGEPLIGAYVRNVNGKEGAETDLNGAFSIYGIPADSKLLFSYIGKKDVVVMASTRKVMDIVMEDDILVMDDVVVTGYQTLSKERATGSFNTISKEHINKPTDNIASRLIGMSSGVQATTDEYGNPSFEIRGLTSLYAAEQPLVVVDGFAIEGDFSSINPNDVETITVLKDAAAASIWGARSANGVIVITTKSGANNSSKKGVAVDISSFVKISPKCDVDYLMSTASSADVIDYEKKAFAHWGSWPIEDYNDVYCFIGSFSPALVDLNENYLGYLSTEDLNKRLDAYSKLDNSNQIKKYLLQNLVTFQHNATISMKNDYSNNVISLMREDSDYYLKGDNSNRMMVNYRSNVKLFKWLDFSFAAMYSYSKSKNNSESLLYGFTPYEMLVNEDGSRAAINNGFYMPNIQRYVPTENFPCSDWTYNPISERESHNKTTVNMNARIQAGLKANIIKGLSVESKIQYELYNSENKSLYDRNSFYVRKLMNTTSSWNMDDNTVTSNLPDGDILDQSRSRVDSWNFRNQVNFNRSFGKHSVSFAGGTELRERVAKGYGYPTTYGYDDERLSVGVFPNGPGSSSNNNLRIEGWDGYKVYFNYNNSFTYRTDRYFSLYSNISYTFNDKYTISGSARTDASNLIADDPSYRYSPFWSIGYGWQISKEKFMKNINWVDRLNLRVTYGYNGNVDKSTSFKPLITLYPTNYPYTNEPYGQISSFGNPSLRWEKTGALDVGLDYSLFKGKLYGKIEAYNKQTKDMIARISIPSFNGTTSQKLNNAEMNNRGLEFEVGSWIRIADKITWNGNFNISYNRNKITKLFKSRYQSYDLISGGQLAFMEGENANSLWCYKYAGVYNVGSEENPNFQPKITDKNGNLYDFSSYPSIDGRELSYYMGTTVAPWTMGFSSNFTIYDFDLSFTLTGKFGHKFMRQGFNYPISSSGRMTPNRQYSEIVNCDPMQRIPLPMNGESEDNYDSWTNFSDYMSYLATNAGVVRMQEISLTYNVPNILMRKIGIGGCQLYGMVNNVFSIYANSFNEDPEYVRPGIKLRPAYTFGIKIQF